MRSETVFVKDIRRAMAAHPDKKFTSAAFILEAAVSAGISLGTDGNNALTVIRPASVPLEIWKPLEAALLEHYDEVITLLEDGAALARLHLEDVAGSA
jgi:hypothetical protein